MLRARWFPLLALGLGLCGCARSETIWREGEQPTSHTMNRHPWWYDQVKRDELSGGDWISNFSPDKEGLATYEIDVPSAGLYHFWLRANPVQSNLAYRVDGGESREIDFAGARDSRNIAADGALDLRFIAWVKVADLDLKPGKLTLEFRAHNDNPDLQNHGAIDVILLTTDDVLPEGTGREGAAAPVLAMADDQSWPFEPGPDPFSDEALLDLRGLNEAVAGETGFVRLSEDGMGFVRGDGQPIRFWSVVSGGYGLSPEDMDRHCRWLAKLGVNMIRIHMDIANTADGARITDVNEELLDRIFRFVAAGRQQGIYFTISPYWAHLKTPASWGLANYTEGPWGLLFFHQPLQEAYRAWVRELYTRTNPYTGLALRDDPAVAIAQVQNEDSLLFWTAQEIKEPYAGELRERFGQWLTARYGSLDAALTAWGGAGDEKDDFARGEAGLALIWSLTSQAPTPDEGRTRRLADQLEFTATLQHQWYADVTAYMRDELGLKQLTNASNWRTADPVLLEDAERWTYTATDLLALNRYTGGIHTGEMVGWRIDPGQHYVNESVLTHPETFPSAVKQVEGHPFVLTEVSWTSPADYQTEGPFLTACYNSLTGVDSTYWFSFGGDPTWTTNPVWPWWKAPNGDNSLKKWEGAVPQQAGMFPAAALAFRLGYVAQAEAPAVREERALEDLWARKVPIIAEAGKFDPNRDAGAFAAQSPIHAEVDRLAFLVGPVVARYGGDAARSQVADLTRYIDRASGTIRSLTGQLIWDAKQGVCTADAPRFQGVAGFLKAAGGSFDLTDVTVRSDNDYATVIVTPLDGRPIAQSASLLVQVGTTAQTTGWTVREETFIEGGATLEGRRILAAGSAPWRVANTRVSLSVRGAALTRATLLDVNGYPAGEVPVTREGDAVRLELPANAMYVVLR